MFKWFLHDVATDRWIVDPSKAVLYVCPICKEEQVAAIGTVDPAEPPPCGGCSERSFRRELAEADEARRFASSLAAAEVPSRFRRPGFVEPSPWPEITPGNLALDSWMRREADRDSHPWLVVVVGPTGTGKSTLATAALISRLSGPFCRQDRGLWCDAATSAEALFGLRGSDLLSRMIEAGVLLIDDLGREASTTAAAKLATILGARYNNLAPTLITTNLQPRELIGIDAGLGRRIETGGFVVLRERWRKA